MATTYADHFIELFDGYYYENYTDGDTACDEPEKIYTLFLPAFYSLIFLLGVVGNALMVTVLLMRRRRMRIAEIYLLHLALADLMLLFTFPFELVDCVAGWVFGMFFCMLTSVLKELNLLSGTLLLACIGFDRYLAIVHAIPSMQSRRPRTVHLTCLSLWVLCLLLSLPNSVFLSVEKDTNTSQLVCFFHNLEVHAHDWVVANRIVKNFCFFFCLVVMSYCYSALALTLSRSQKRRAKKGAIRLAVLVTLVFCVCWLPHNVTSLVKSLEETGYVRYDTCASRDLLRQVYEVTLMLGVSHCCLNPVLYAFVGVQFRRELLQLLWQLGRICPSIRAESQNRRSISEGTTNSTNFSH